MFKTLKTASQKKRKEMKVNFKIIIMAIAIVFLAASCGKGSSVDAALSQIEKAMDKIEKNKGTMTEADWQAMSEELEAPFKILNDALENNQIGAMKKLKITAVLMRYAAVASGAAVNTMTDLLKESHLTDSISSIATKLQEEFDSDVMDQAMQELQNAADELQKIAK